MKKFSLILSVLTVMLMVVGCGSKASSSSSNNSNTSSNKNKDSIVQLYIGYESVVMLTNNGDLYVIGDNIYNWGSIVEEVKEPTLAATNVKKFYNGGNAYITKDNDLYIAGVNPIEGGTYSEYEKIGSNIISVSCSNGLGILAVSTDNKLYSFGKSGFNGTNVDYAELTEIDEIENIKDVFIDYGSYTYITQNGEIYAKNSDNDEYTMILDNVSETNGWYAMTNDNKIYVIDENKARLVENANGAIELKDGTTYLTSNGLLYSSNTDYSDKNKYMPSDVNELLYCYRFSDLVTDINELLYIYLNDNNKIVLYRVNYATGTTEENVELDYNIDSMKKIYNFVYENVHEKIFK